MSKTVKIRVTSAFVYEGKIRTPGQTVTMAEADAKPILEREKAVLAKGRDDADTEGAKSPKPAVKDTKAPAKDGKDAGGKDAENKKD